jgi:hypothetical protein
MKRLILLLLMAISLNVSAQWQGASGTWQKNTVQNQWRFNAGLNGIFAPYDVFAKIEDGLISGGEATLGSGSVTIDTALYRINGTNYTSLPRTFTGIANSPSGTQYYLVVYGQIGGTLDTLSGVRDSVLVLPTLPANTEAVNTIIVGSGGVISATPDLSGFAPKDGTGAFGNWNINAATSSSSFNSTLWNSQKFNGSLNTDINTFMAYDLTFDEWRPASISMVKAVLAPDTTIYRLVANSYSLASGQPRLVSGTNIKTVNSNSLLGSGNISVGTVTSVSSLTLGTTGTDLNSSVTNSTTTPVITLNVPNASATNRGALTSSDWSLFNGKENALTFSAPLSRSVNTISIPAATTSVSGHLTSTDWNTFNNKQNTISFGAIGSTPNANGASIASSVITLQPANASFGGIVTTGTQTFSGLKTFSTSPQITTVTASTSNYRLATRNQTSGALEEIDLGTINGALVYEGSGKTISVAPAADRTTANSISISANRTLTLSDFGSNGQVYIFANTTSASVTITLPNASTMVGLEVTVIKTTASNSTIVQGNANINGATPNTHTAQYKAVTYISNGTEYFIKSERP